MTRLTTIVVAWTLLCSVDAFPPIAPTTSIRNTNSRPSLLHLKSWSDDSNTWISSSDTSTTSEEDWETKLKKRQNGSYWSDFDDELPTAGRQDSDDENVDDDGSEEMLDTLASLQADEVAFNVREAVRADTLRQMEEWGFEPSTIASALNVAVAEDQEGEEVEGMQGYREASHLDIEDLYTVESHTKVPKDLDNEPLRSQMVYVDEHACIGCTNCAMIAQSTFFMEEENGRARVFEQWGDDDKTIQIAIETCPVSCIHYVPYEELVQLEIQRRDQYINVLAGLVSRAERGAGSGLMSSTPRSFGSKSFTDAPRVSRAYDGENPDFEAKEKLRLQKERRRQLEQKRRRDNKIVDL